MRGCPKRGLLNETVPLNSEEASQTTLKVGMEASFCVQSNADVEGQKSENDFWDSPFFYFLIILKSLFISILHINY